MYKLKLLCKNKFIITWSDIYCGISNNLINHEEIISFVDNELTKQENKEIEKELIDLEWATNEMEIKSILLKIINKAENLHKNNSLKKWRYCILKSIVDSSISDTYVLEAVESVYSDFDYPKDMESFIFYMPQKDNRDSSKYSIEENRKYLVNNLKIFLSKEKKLID